MNLLKAREISSLFESLFIEKSGTLFVRKSRLNGCSFSEVGIALKLQLASDFLIFSDTPQKMAHFNKKAELYDTASVRMVLDFIPDEQMDELERLIPDGPEYERKSVELFTRSYKDENSEKKDWEKAETVISFAEYCKQVGKNDPLYWQKVYTRLNLPFKGHDSLYLSKVEITQSAEQIHQSQQGAGGWDSLSPMTKFWISWVVIIVVYMLIVMLVEG